VNTLPPTNKNLINCDWITRIQRENAEVNEGTRGQGNNMSTAASKSGNGFSRGEKGKVKELREILVFKLPCA
jgi:hypothetical protein